MISLESQITFQEGRVAYLEARQASAATVTGYQAVLATLRNVRRVQQDAELAKPWTPAEQFNIWIQGLAPQHS